jgi:CheY-like chemotaxis protein
MTERQPAQILAVDDEAAIRLTLDALLKRCGYLVVLAANGEEALAQIQRHAVDVVLLDLLMPGMDGLEVARQMRSLQPAAAIFMLTGSSAWADAAQEGYEYMLKTTSPQAVLARIAAVLAKQAAGMLPAEQPGPANGT